MEKEIIRDYIYDSAAVIYTMSFYAYANLCRDDAGVQRLITELERQGFISPVRNGITREQRGEALYNAISQVEECLSLSEREVRAFITWTLRKVRDAKHRATYIRDAGGNFVTNLDLQQYFSVAFYDIERFIEAFVLRCCDYGYKELFIEVDAEVEEYINRQWGVAPNSEEVSSLPTPLTSPEAQTLLTRAVKAGYLTPEYRWIEQGHTRYQQAYLADRICDKLGIASKWKVFGELWGYKLLSQRFSDITNGGYSVANREEIDNLCRL